MVFRKNQFYEIRDRASGDKGAITRPITAGIVFDGNWFARSDFLADSTPPSYFGDPMYKNNTRVAVSEIQRPHLNSDGVPEDNAVAVPYDEPPNRRAIARLGYDTYERKRWTGPERVSGAIPAARPATHEPPDDPVLHRLGGPS